MSTTRLLAFSLPFVAAALLVIAILQNGFSWLVVAIILFVLAWLYFFFSSHRWIQDAGFVAILTLAAIAIYQLPPPAETDVEFHLILVAVLLALASWDIAAFDYRLHLVGDSALADLLRRRHFTRLGLVLLLSFLIVLVAYFWNLSLPFGWSILLVLLSVLGIAFLSNILLTWVEKHKSES